ncbi:hypothetical protein QJS10_CPB19g00190 [Acorus calamus]|uniref:Uncharacterized protein n=1 Tax=Acorus calamus TaxID=4465 RepID=A0AAV9CJA9_ACOCL|nr:hypothetical protein QJS10_CPB19g00190 [Acorus calamus]
MASLDPPPPPPPPPALTTTATRIPRVANPSMFLDVRSIRASPFASSADRRWISLRSCRRGSVAISGRSRTAVVLAKSLGEGLERSRTAVDDNGAAMVVVMASRGYPGPYEKGTVIKNLHEAEACRTDGQDLPCRD